jgi:hypothetical protein
MLQYDFIKIKFSEEIITLILLKMPQSIRCDYQDNVITRYNYRFLSKPIIYNSWLLSFLSVGFKDLIICDISGSHGGEYEDGCLLGCWAV